MKILFLDVDGVLNYDGLWWNNVNRPPNSGTYVLDPALIQKVNELLRKVGAYIVLSTSWRNSEDHVQYLREHGALIYMHDDWRTVNKGHIRGQEIEEWLERHSEVTRYAIVDDNSDMLYEQLPYFVQTNPETGITDKDIRRLELILS